MLTGKKTNALKKLPVNYYFHYNIQTNKMSIDKKKLLLAIKDGTIKNDADLRAWASVERLNVKDGVDGHTPTDEELIALIEPLIPEAIAGTDGTDGSDGITPTKEELLSLIKPLIPKPVKGKDGKDGKTPDTSQVALEATERAVEQITPLIPTLEQIEERLPVLGESIRNSLELLQKEERLDSSAIKGLSKIQADILKRATSILDQRTQFLINKRVAWGTIVGTITEQTDLIEYIAEQIAPENTWDRTGTVLSPHTAGDDVLTTGRVDGSNIIDGVGVAKITVGTTEPTSPATGDLWLDTN